MRKQIETYRMADLSMRYSRFIPRVYNLAKSLGFTPGKIMPSRAFCSDESQGYPTILIAKHFGSFPFNHGRVGGIVATDRHRPHAHHGKDLVIIHASHVGFNPDSQRFGKYRRLHTAREIETASCGKISNVIRWYAQAYQDAQENIFLSKNDNDEITVTIGAQLLVTQRKEGLFLDLEELVDLGRKPYPAILDSGQPATEFHAAQKLVKAYQKRDTGDEATFPIGSLLTSDYFFYRRSIEESYEGHAHLEKNLHDYMPDIVTSPWPSLLAAQINTELEFIRTQQSIEEESSYRKKKVLFISGLNVDMSPHSEETFPLTKFIPWAAFYKDDYEEGQCWNQEELHATLKQQSNENPDQVDLEAAIESQRSAEEIRLPF